ncbi:MAG: aldehyde dehydrogenase [Anaerolineales bacterium]|nr:aldehyde dehydrogenase [Anaerolineales bacterium]
MSKMLINGQWTDALNGETHPVFNPANGQVVDTVPAASRADVDLAVKAAQAALPGWADVSPDERAALIRQGLHQVAAQAKEIAALLTAEQGKPAFEAQSEVQHFLHGMEFYAGLASKLRGAQVPLPPALGKHAYGLVLKRPVGVCAGIVPWNFPLTLMGTKVGPALMAGNPILIKPARTTPLATLKIIGLLNEAGLPPGVLQCLTGAGSVVGESLVTHPAVRRVALTGSSETGRRVMQIAGADFKRITLELGGSDPCIVCPDANLKRALSGVVVGRYWNAGQQCLAIKRLYVFAEVYDAFVEGLLERVGSYRLGDGATRPEKPFIRMGPLHSAQQRAEVEGQLADAVARGAKVLIGGQRPNERALKDGHFFEPAVVLDVPADSRLATEEVFGPVLPIWKVKALDEAIEKANGSPWGLGSSIWTQNLSWANRAIREIEAGVTWVNQIHYGYDELPFGGVKASGLGHEHGPEAVEYYLERKGAVFGGLDWE